jgi:hypothetical protein
MGELASATKYMTAGYSISRGSTSLMINAYPVNTLRPLQQGLHMQPRSTVRTTNALLAALPQASLASGCAAFQSPMSHIQNVLSRQHLLQLLGVHLECIQPFIQ